jgi:hypothetical protein
MADDGNEIEVESTVEVSLSLHVGGSFSYKSQLYEYPASGGDPTPTAAETSGTATVSIGRVDKGVVRRFVWSVVVVNGDDGEQTVDVSGRVMVASKMVGSVKGTMPIKGPLQKAFVNLHLKGKGA